MTVAIGLVCKDGVIVASDSMATTSAQIAVESVKVSAFANNPVVWTSSGAVYVKEEVAVGIDSKLDAKVEDVFTGPAINQLRSRIKAAVHPVMQKCYSGVLSVEKWPPGTITQGVATSFLFAGYAKETPWLLEIDHDGSLNWHTTPRFYAIGSGGHFASVCYGLMKHYVVDDLPLEKGMQLAYRAIETTCDVSAAHVGLPVQMAVVDESGQRILGSDEINRLGVLVQRWKELERDTLIEQVEASEAPEELPSVDVSDPSGAGTA